jgi:hypothetical protein
MNPFWAINHKKIKFVFSVPEISLPPSSKGQKNKHKNYPLHLYTSLLSKLRYVLSEHTPFRWQWAALLNYDRSVTHCGFDGLLADSGHCSWVVHAHKEQEATALTAMLYINTTNSCATHHLTSPSSTLWGSLQNSIHF